MKVLVRQELETQKHLNQIKEAEKAEREAANKKTLQNDLLDLRERVDFVTKDYYQLKNEQSSQIAAAAKDVHYLQEAMQAV